jgi:hypothetical protein
MEFKKEKKKKSKIQSFIINNHRLNKLGELYWDACHEPGFSRLNFFEYRIINEYDKTFLEIANEETITRFKLLDNLFSLPIDFKIKLNLYDDDNHALEISCHVNIIPDVKKTTWYDVADRVDYLIVCFELDEIVFFDSFNQKRTLIPFFMCSRARVFHRDKNYNMILTGKQDFEKIYYCVMCC